MGSGFARRRLPLDCRRLAIDNDAMKVRGRVHNGVVVLERRAALPEGTTVTVSCNIAPVSQPRRKKKRVEFPLVRSKHPATLHLTDSMERYLEPAEERER